MASPKARIRRVTIHVPDADLHTTLVRGVGYRAHCACGWRSGKCGDYQTARGWLAHHRAETHP